MRRSDLATEVLAAWTRLSPPARNKFFAEFLAVAIRVERLDVREFLRRKLRTPPLKPIDLSRLTLSDGDIATVLGKTAVRVKCGRPGRPDPQ